MSPRLQALRGEFAGGVASAIPGLAHALTLGLLAFAPLGPGHADIGIRAGFAAGIFGGIAATVRSGTPLPATSARASTRLILAGFVATLAADRGRSAQREPAREMPAEVEEDFVGERAQAQHPDQDLEHARQTTDALRELSDGAG